MATARGRVAGEESSYSWPSWPWTTTPVRTTVTEKVHRIATGTSAATDAGHLTTTTTAALTSSSAVTTASASVNSWSPSSGEDAGEEHRWGVSESGGDVLEYGGFGGGGGSFLDEFANDLNGSLSSSNSGNSSSDLLAGALSNFSGSPLGSTARGLFTSGSGSNYSTEFSINFNVSDGESGTSSRLSFAHLPPDLLEEHELMALWNCTNCFLLNYSGSSSSSSSVGLINGTVSTRFGNGTDRDQLLDGDSGFGLGGLDDPESTIFLIRMIATAVVLGIVILATVIGEYA